MITFKQVFLTPHDNWFHRHFRILFHSDIDDWKGIQSWCHLPGVGNVITPLDSSRFAAIAHLLMEDTSIPDYYEIVMQTIEEYPPSFNRKALSMAEPFSLQSVKEGNVPKTVFSETGLVKCIGSPIGNLSTHSRSSIIWLMLSSIIWCVEQLLEKKLYAGHCSDDDLLWHFRKHLHWLPPIWRNHKQALCISFGEGIGELLCIVWSVFENTIKADATISPSCTIEWIRFLEN